MFKIINASKLIEQIDTLTQEMKNSGSKGSDLLAEGQAAMLVELAKRIDADVAAAIKQLREELTR